MTATQTLIRFALLLAALVIAVGLVATHGVRGIAIVVAIGLLVTLPQTRSWRVVEGALVRLTGSRKRAAMAALFLVIVIAGAVSLLQTFA